MSRKYGVWLPHACNAINWFEDRIDAVLYKSLLAEHFPEKAKEFFIELADGWPD